MKIIGLTGGMGMGKSAVAKMIMGVTGYDGSAHQDMDEVIHAMYGWDDAIGPSEYLVGIIRSYYPEIIDHSDYGPIVSRPALLKLIRDKPVVLDWLEDVIGLVMSASLTEHLMDGEDDDVILFDAPLLFENIIHGPEGDHSLWNMIEKIRKRKPETKLATILVSCPPEIQKARCMARPGMTPEKFEMLISRQMSDVEKRSLSDYVIDTSGTLDDTREQVQDILVVLKLKGFF